jgi:uncharacterized protein YkwD
VRSAHGLSELAVDPRLQAIAKEHVADLVAHQWYCHCWADGSTILDHAQAAGIGIAQLPSVTGAPGVFQYGVGDGFASIQGAAAVSELFTSPGHRRDLLRDRTDVGIAASGDQSLPVLLIEYVAEQ